MPTSSSETAQTYLTAKGTTRVSLFDVTTRQEQLLTSDANANGPFDESSPSWSPDGTRIAFVSNHDEDWDRTRNQDVFVVDARPGSASRKLTTFPGQDGGSGFGDGVAWSPDGKWIAYGQGSEPKTELPQPQPSCVGRGRWQRPAEAADRRFSIAASRGAQFSADGSSLLFTVADDRTVYLARVAVRAARSSA